MDLTIVITSVLTSTVVSGLTTVAMKYYFDRRLITFTAQSGRLEQSVQKRNDALLEFGGQVYRIRNTARALLSHDLTLGACRKELDAEVKKLEELQYTHRILLTRDLYPLIHNLFYPKASSFQQLVKHVNQLAVKDGADPESETIEYLIASRPSEKYDLATRLSEEYSRMNFAYQNISEKFNSVIWSRDAAK